MDPFVSKASADAETPIARERLHKGIFILPVLTFIAIIIPELLFIGMIQKLFSSMPHFGPARQQTGLPGIFYAFFLLIGALPGLIALLAAWVSYQKSEITLTTKRLLFRAGFLNKISGDLPLENVESIYIAEPLFGRILGYGTVAVTSVGGASFPLRFIGSPQQFHSKLQQAVATAKSPAKHSSPIPSSAPRPSDDSRYMPKS